MSEQDQTTMGHSRRDADDASGDDDTAGHSRRDAEDTTGDDAEGHNFRHG